MYIPWFIETDHAINISTEQCTTQFKIIFRKKKACR